MTISKGTASMRLVRHIQLLFGLQSTRSPTRARRGRVTKRQSAPASSDPFLQELWNNLCQEYFPQVTTLDTYTVTWSVRRQKRVLASCNIRQRRVVVARELYEPSACRWISAVLYHELCHAVIGEGVDVRGGRRQWHGAQFRALEARHPDIKALDVWIKSGGWAMAVRANRSRNAWARRHSGQV
jgi:hypothetical protein